MGVRGLAGQGGGLLKTLAVRLAQVAATVVVTWFVADRAGLTLAELRAVDFGIWSPDWPLFGLSCAVLFAGYVLSSHLWGRIVHGLGGRRLGAGRSVPLYMIANLGRYVPGKIWQIAALATLARQNGIAASTATAAAVLLQGMALGAAALVGAGTLWTLAEGAPWRWVVPAAVLSVALLGLTPPVFGFLSSSWFRLSRTPDPPSLAPGDAVGWMVLALVNWAVYAGAFWMMVRGLGVEAGLLTAASAFAAAYVAGYVAIFAPAGIGVREASLVAFLSPQLGPGTAGAVALVARVWTTAVEVVPASIFWGRYLAHPVQDSEAGPSGTSTPGQAEEPSGREGREGVGDRV